MHYEDSLGPDLAPPQTQASANRPANVPAKFWDPAKGEIRTEALLRAYQDLERRISAPAKPAPAAEPAIPASPDHYQISHCHPDLASSPVVNQRLHDAAFTQDQAQLVYDLAHECLMPLLEKAGQQADLSHLQQHFGGESRWQQIKPQLAAWGKKNLPADAFAALASWADGVKILNRLMASGEPSLGQAPAAANEGATEEDLKKMLQDPRYWKTRDPAFIAKVTNGFLRLSGE